MKHAFKILSLITSALFLYLFLSWLLNTQAFFDEAALADNEAALLVGRRASVFMLGMSVLLFSARNAPHGAARQPILLATGVTMLGLAFAGGHEYYCGRLGSGIWTAIPIEVGLGVAYIALWFSARARPGASDSSADPSQASAP